MEGGENGTVFFKSFQVFIVLIRSLIFPTSEENANPFEGQSANDGVILFAFGPIVIDVIASPLAAANREAGKFMKGLPIRLRAGHPEMDHAGSTTAFCDRSYPANTLSIFGGLETRTIRSKEGDQPRRQRRSSARQVGEDFGPTSTPIPQTPLNPAMVVMNWSGGCETC